MTKLLWHSNSPMAPTGYGSQTALFTPRLAERYDLAISSFYGLEGSRIRWNGIPVFPGLGGEFGNGYLTEHAANWFGGNPRDGLVVTLLDVWVLNPQMASRMNMCCWVPVDHDPAPAAVTGFFANSGAVPLAMSRFGEEQLAPLGPIYVPHGVDVDAYKPYPQAEVRKAVGVPEDAFLVGMVAANKGANPSRKGFQQAFEAFRLFQQRHDDAYLYLHTVANPELANGEDIPRLLASLEIPPESVLLADQYRMLFDPLPARSMAQVYSTFDVLLNPAMGEGFGLAPLEAQACGVPVIVTDFSAMKEVCGSGWTVECRPYWTAQKSWQAIPDVADILEALDRCYGLPLATRKRMGEQARSHALKYAAPKVLEDHMLPALEEVRRRFADREPVEISPQAQEQVAA